MEKKMLTQRTIGILVVVGFALVLLSMIFSKNETAPKKTTIVQAAPQFSDKPPIEDKPAITVAESKPDTSPLASIPSNDVIPAKQETVVAASQSEPEGKSVETSPLLPKQPEPNLPLVSNAEENTPAPAEEAKPSVSKQPIHAEHKVKPVKTLAKRKTETSVKKLHSPAWVIQLGCFNSKSNARQLTDQLRLAGFKAFNREVKSKTGKSTIRVLVGPEYKHASAIKLSTKLEQRMKLHGIVLSYKPLEL